MIYTITLNPALDYVIQVNHFKTGIINRTKEEHVYYGGKGINVSSILKELDISSCALGFIAGFTGDALQKGLENQGIDTQFISVKQGMTRINVKMKSDEETEINGMGPIITTQDLDQLKSIVKKLEPQDILILSGSIPSCLKSDTYQQIIETLPSDVRFIVDAEKNLLLKALPYHPFLIKPNHLELSQIFDAQIKTEEDIIFYAKKLQEKGARNVLVSRAGDGAILVDENENVYIQPACKGQVVNSVGAGDSMVAGFLAGYLKTNDYHEAMRLATACGGATAFHSGLAKKEQIEELLKTL